MTWSDVISFWAFGPVVVCLMVAAACSMHLLVHRYRRPGALPERNATVGLIIGVVGGIYTVLLSFVVIVVWQQFNTAEANAQKEASAIADLHHLSFGFPQPLRRQVGDNLKAYANSVVFVEFKAMAEGHDPGDVRELAVNLINLIANWEHENPTGRKPSKCRAFNDARFFQRAARTSEGQPVIYPGVAVGHLVVRSGHRDRVYFSHQRFGVSHPRLHDGLFDRADRSAFRPHYRIKPSVYRNVIRRSYPRVDQHHQGSKPLAEKPA
ncbi:MAG: hypothetical protein M3T49_04695 [Candidatus Eremiobacteraeota bacterium]|nr:hypothetical protein [Candidatus Eremiobacteraeota bacterium]